MSMMYTLLLLFLCRLSAASTATTTTTGPWWLTTTSGSPSPSTTNTGAPWPSTTTTWAPWPSTTTTGSPSTTTTLSPFEALVDTEFEVLLKRDQGSVFSADFLKYTGTENPNDPSASTFSIIGLQGDGEHLRYGDGGDFIFRYEYYGYLSWSPTGDRSDAVNDESTYYSFTWSQSTWLTETYASDVTVDYNYGYPEGALGAFGGLFRDVADDPAGYLTDGMGGVYGAFRGIVGTPIWPHQYVFGSALSEQLSVYYVQKSAYNQNYVSITSCEGWNAAETTGTISISLRGTNGTTPFILVNPFSNNLPWDGRSAVFNFDASEVHIGTLLSATLDVGVIDGFCISALSIVSDSAQCQGDEAGACNFGDEYFGRGMVLAPRGNCPSSFVSVLSGDDDPLLTCYDEGFLDLHTHTKRGIVDLSIHSCNLEHADIFALSEGELSVVLSGKEGISTTFVNTDVVELTISDYWPVNTWRRFEINVEAPLSTVTLAQLMYSNDNDFCVDLLFANDLSATYLSDNWLSAHYGYAESLTAVFKWPVCATEVINMRVSADYSSGDVQNGASFISGLECSNYNRMVSSTCTISQSYETSKSTSFSFAEATSTETSTTTDYSWGRDTAFEQSISSGTSTSNANEFAFGFNQQVTVGAEAKVGAVFAEATASLDVSVGANQDWSRSTETTTSSESTSGSTWGSNQAVSQGSGTSTGSENSAENSFETSESAAITCEASMEVPPSHSVTYSLVFNAFDATIRTYSDMKLTLCSALIDGDEAAGDDYVYITDIPGTITHSETTGCEVQFEPAQYLANYVDCAEEEKLAIAAGATYIPRCQSDDGAQYEPCQCDIGDTLTMGVCWCSDAEGNPSDTKIYQFDSSTEFTSDATVCAHLDCSGGQPTRSPTPSPTDAPIVPGSPTRAPTGPTTPPSGSPTPSTTSTTTTSTTTTTTTTSFPEDESEGEDDGDDDALVQEEAEEVDESALQWVDVNADLVNILVCVAAIYIAMVTAAKCWTWIRALGLCGAGAEAANERKSGLEMEMATVVEKEKETSTV